MKKLFGTDVVYSKSINASGQPFTQYEKQLDEKLHVIEKRENYIGDSKDRKDFSNSDCRRNTIEMNTEKKDYQKNSLEKL